MRMCVHNCKQNEFVQTYMHTLYTYVHNNIMLTANNLKHFVQFFFFFFSRTGKSLNWKFRIFSTFVQCKYNNIGLMQIKF